MKIRSFTDLHAWREGHRLVLDIYQVTKKFPSDERYCLTDQMRRAAISVTSNISEGFSRRTKKEKAQFLRLALGSLTELQNQLLTARDISYISSLQFTSLAEKTVGISKLVNFIHNT